MTFRLALGHAIVASALLFGGTAAQAITITINTNSNFVLPTGSSNRVIQDFSGTLTQRAGSQPLGLGAVATSGGTVAVYAASVSGVARRPGDVTGSTGNAMLGLTPSSGRFMALTGVNSFYTLTFAQPLRSISFGLGSFTSDYRVILGRGDGSQTILNGAAILGLSSFPVEGNAFVRYDAPSNDPNLIERAKGGFTSITFRKTSASPAIEISAISGAVPEPATWAMLIGGFGIAGIALRRQRKLVTA